MGIGVENEVLVAKNLNMNPSAPPNLGEYTLDGQIPIGSTLYPNIRPGFLLSPDGSVGINYNRPNIELTVDNSNTPNPFATVNISDDFIGIRSDLGTGFSSQLAWQAAVTKFNFNEDSTPGHPGVITNKIMADGSNSVMTLYLDSLDSDLNAAKNVLQGAGVLTCTWLINLAILSNNTDAYLLRVGMAWRSQATGSPGDEYDDGFYFTYTNSVNSGNWVINTANSGVRTATNTSIAAVTGWVKLSVVVNAAGTSAEYFINGVSGGTITTNFPDTGFGPAFQAVKTAGTPAAKSWGIDIMQLIYPLTNPR